MKKVIGCLICLLLLTGCTVRSNITLNYDGTLTETVSILESNSMFGSDESYKKIVDNKLDNYKNILNFKNYNYDYEKGNQLSGAKVYKNYDNLCSYFGNSAFNQYIYKYIKCNESDYFIEIKNSTEYIPYCPECGNWPALDDVTLSIKLPVAAEEQNADEIDGNTYIWKYNKDTKDKNFYLKINKNSLKQYEEQYAKDQKTKKTIKKITILGVIASIIIIVVIIESILYKKYKKNNFDY